MWLKVFFNQTWSTLLGESCIFQLPAFTEKRDWLHSSHQERSHGYDMKRLTLC